ncbi:hypothetical protein LPJ53_005084 [Coemansia erecta]|uniref:Peptide hydrolase n=1 Tax=Coemansia erecta TaxID=147472 RepID=A0A9W8CQ78_9FUNG|nr:hypothetical protein LPJ53_005084 [Coemansia erecta]
MCRMIPDEKKAIPWGLPPLRSDAAVGRRPAPHHEAAPPAPATPASTSHPHSPGKYEELGIAAPASRGGRAAGLRQRLAVVLAGLLAVSLALAYLRTAHTVCSTTPSDTLATVNWLLQQGLDGGNTVAWDRLAEMTDLYGHRMTGSAAYNRSAAWVVRTAAGQDNLTAYTEPVVVDVWRRGAESLHLLMPTRANGTVQLAVLALGNSASTPAGGITAPVVPVRSFDELASLGSRGVLAGSVVLFNFAYTQYGASVGFRTRGAEEAQKYGALAVLVRSLAPDSSFASVHTGNSRRAAIPAGSVCAADANLLERTYRRAQKSGATRGEGPHVRLVLESEFGADAGRSDNVVVDLQGREQGDGSVVVVSGHFDSWDVGVGALDDGAGAFVAWEAQRLIGLSGRRPRRTVRVVMWSNEETRQRGAHAYLERHRAELPQHFFAIESDIGVFEPWGLTVDASDAWTRRMRGWGRDIVHVLAAGNVTTPEVEGPGEDIRVLCREGVPCAGLLGVNPENAAVPGDALWTEHYFRHHHAASDRVEAVDAHQLRRSAAALAAWTYLIADLP